MSAAMDLERFRELARTHRVIPVTRTLLADGESAVGLYRKLAGERPGTFLLESAEHGQMWSRYSFIGVRSQATLTAANDHAIWLGQPPAGVPTGGSPWDTLEATINYLRTPRMPDLPPLTGGLVGFLAYDAVRRLEVLPSLAANEESVPELAFMLASDMAVLDHHQGTLTLIANAINWDGSDARVDEAFAESMARLDQMEKDLQASQSGDALRIPEPDQPQATRSTTSEQFQAAVEKVKEEIRSGEAFQVVLSQRFTLECTASALNVYRMLRRSNPSPYMYLLRFEEFDIVGSSPEALVKVSEGHVMVHPIAGTRPRGATPEEDAALAVGLLEDPKERAEHLMLVDLGRNDLGRVCAPGSVDVVEFMNIERYSHVMHIVSTVVGQLDSSRSAIDALKATFPAGTLSGAPKPRAMEIIESLEPMRRGLYGGVVGYIDFAGDLDVAIAIRTAFIRSGMAWVQAGAGVVADSDPVAEDLECQNKAAAVLRAISMANSLSTTSSKSASLGS
jgi:anthranilate synthase component I